ncbi:hypothetical protein QTA57_15745 [Fontisubflavum oceani]|nr:hypothetical protein [Fontisubflavum oceani]WJY21208.1 hypothetical protein QTA57_15745 [Fontisubflavum oceani]
MCSHFMGRHPGLDAAGREASTEAVRTFGQPTVRRLTECHELGPVLPELDVTVLAIGHFNQRLLGELSGIIER